MKRRSHTLVLAALFLLSFGAAAAQAPAAPWKFVVGGDSRNCGDVVMPAVAAGAVSAGRGVLLAPGRLPRALRLRRGHPPARRVSGRDEAHDHRLPEARLGRFPPEPDRPLRRDAGLFWRSATTSSSPEVARRVPGAVRRLVQSLRRSRPAAERQPEGPQTEDLLSLDPERGGLHRSRQRVATTSSIRSRSRGSRSVVARDAPTPPLRRSSPACTPPCPTASPSTTA